MSWKRVGPAAAALMSAALLGIVGCSKSSDSGNKGAAENTTPAKAKPEAPAPEAARVVPVAVPTGGPTTGNETKEYKIELAAPKEIAAGAESALTVVVTPKTGWHFNLDFPTSVAVEVPEGVKVAKAKQGLDDAVAKSEEQGATWAIKVTPDKAGASTLTAKVKFAVCTETTCDPKKETLALQLDAK